MTWKDWLTLLPAWLGAALGVYNLLRARWAEAEKSDPQIDILVDRLQGRGPWDMRFSVKNRADTRIDVIGIFLRRNRLVRFVQTSREQEVTLLTARGLHAYDGTAGAADLAPGSAFSGLAKFEPISGDERIAGPVELTFVVLFRVQGGARRPQRRFRRIIARP